MNNYEYIIASLPQISRDNANQEDFSDVREQIRSQLSDKDLALLRIFEDGFSEEKLSPEFYREALESRNGFIRGYFAFDLVLRNCKVRFINIELGRPVERDIIDIGNWSESDDRPEVQTALSAKDLLAREKALDNLLWNKSDGLALSHYFDIDVILSFLAKLNIVERWMKLDKTTGKEMFRKLIDELKDSYTI